MATIQEALALAFQHHQAGHLAQAEQLYRQVLQADPAHAAAWHLLGVLAYQCGRHDLAVTYIGQALVIQPHEAAFRSDLGLVYHAQGQWAEAEACYREALRLRPNFPEAHCNLGNVLRDRGRLAEAEGCYREALRLRPDYPEAHCNLGNVLKDQGRLEEAEACCRQALRLRPDLPEAHNNLGSILKDRGRLEEAEACYREALRLRPGYPDAHNNLGNVLQDRGRLEEAEACYRQALRLCPDFPEAQYNLGNALEDCGQLEEAEACYREALRLRSDFPEAHNNLGNVLQDRGRLEEAEVCFRAALRLRPSYPEAHNNLGQALKDRGRLEEAEVCFREALRLRPAFPEAHNNLGNVLRDWRRLEEAEACLREALRLRPDFPDAHNNLGNVLKDQGRLAEAEACYRAALRLRPDYPDAHNNLGNVLKDQGRLDEALAAYRRAVVLRPESATFHSNILYTLHFHPEEGEAHRLGEEHRRWNERHAEPLSPGSRPRAHDPDPERRLRVGYVSPDFRLHPVGRFLLPLLEAHDRRRVESFCYASVAVPDELTRRLHGHADHWRDVLGLSDEQLAQRVREDRIDILVDLTAHMANHRLLTFARQPAPVQVSYLAYCSTTGLAAIDYRLTDPFLDPPGPPPRCYTEASLWLPQTYWCYRPHLDLPPAGPLPARSAGYVTFGCLNNFCKVTPPALAAWRDLLAAVPHSRLLLHAHAGRHRQRVRAFFAEGGVDPGRVEFVGFTPLPEYFGLYERIDLGLDPFPYAGGTTSCDALWMGVPVVSLAGATAVARAGLSILSNAGLAELVARTPEEYVRRAAGLAGDLPRLAALRAGLRARLECSPLTDAPRFARGVEEAYRTMWRRWCAGQTGWSTPA